MNATNQNSAPAYTGGAWNRDTATGKRGAENKAAAAAFNDVLGSLAGVPAGVIRAGCTSVNALGSYFACRDNARDWAELLAARGVTLAADGDAGKALAKLTGSDRGSVVAAAARLSRFSNAASAMLSALDYAPGKGSKPTAKGRDYEAVAADVAAYLADLPADALVPDPAAH